MGIVSKILYYATPVGPFIDFVGVSLGLGTINLEKKDKRAKYLEKFLKKEINRRGYESTLEVNIE